MTITVAKRRNWKSLLMEPNIYVCIHMTGITYALYIPASRRMYNPSRLKKNMQLLVPVRQNQNDSIFYIYILKPYEQRDVFNGAWWA